MTDTTTLTVTALCEVGDLNPASGYGEWPRAEALTEQLAAPAAATTRRVVAGTGLAGYEHHLVGQTVSPNDGMVL